MVKRKTLVFLLQVELYLDVYKMGSKFYIDAGNWDDEAKNSKELKMKLKRYGVNPDKPIFGKIPK